MMGRPSLGRTLDEKKAAHREQQRKYREAHKEELIERQHEAQREHPERRRQVVRKHTYGLSDGGVQLLVEQHGVCAICGKPETHMRLGKVMSLAVDHDHGTGKVCGLLCRKCNLGLGQFEDNSELLRKALDYNDRVRGDQSVGTPDCPD